MLGLYCKHFLKCLEHISLQKTKTWMYNSSFWNNYGLLVMFLIPITIFSFLHTAQILHFDNQLTICTNFYIVCSVFLYIVGLWYKFGNIVAHCFIIFYANDIIFTRLKQWSHIVTDASKENFMNTLEILACCSFMWLCDYIIVVETTQYWPLRAIMY